MKKSLLIGLLAVLALMSVTSWANGKYVPGTVTVNGNPGLSMWGNYNVRYNPAVTKGEVYISINPGQSFSVSGTSSSTGVGFTCFYTVQNGANYYQWQDALKSVTNGGFVIASRVSSTNSTCASIQVQSASSMLD